MEATARLPCSSTGNFTANGDTFIGDAGSGIGGSGTGLLTQSAGTMYLGGIHVGCNTGAVGTVTLSGGQLTVGGTEIGDSGGTGTMSITNATVTAGDWMSIGTSANTSCGTVTINSGGRLNVPDHLFIGRTGGRGVVVLNSGGTISDLGTIYMAEVETGGQNFGELDLNGGSLYVHNFQIGWDTGTGAGGSVTLNGTSITCLGGGEFFNLGGGSGSTSHVYVKAGGATINTNGYNVGSGFPLLASASGTVTKTGLGVFTLEGASTWNGGLVVNQGTVNLTGSYHPSSGGTVTVQSGGIFSGGTSTGATRLTNVVVQSGGMLEPSLPGGTNSRAMSFSNGTLSGGATVLSRIYTSAASGLDSVASTATMNIASSGTVTVDFDLTSAASIPTSTARAYMTYVTLGGTGNLLPAVDTYVYNNTLYDPTLTGTTNRNIAFTTDTSGTATGSRYWKTNGGGTWSTGGNWAAGTAPNATSVRAVFGSASVTSGGTVNLDSAVTLSSLDFITGSTSYTIAPVTGTCTITLNSSLASNNQIADDTGSNTVNASIVMSKNTRVTVALGTSTLTLGGVISGANSVTLYGSGILNLTGANSFTGPIVMNGGMGGTQSGLGTLESLSLANGGTACPLALQQRRLEPRA